METGSRGGGNTFPLKREHLSLETRTSTPLGVDAVCQGKGALPGTVLQAGIDPVVASYPGCSAAAERLGR